MQFEMECDSMWYENKVGTIEGIHSLNLLGENSPNFVLKSSHKDHLPINAACNRMLIWMNHIKTQGLGLTCSFLRKARNSHLIQGVMQWKLRWS
jgi:hypothetical protein